MYTHAQPPTCTHSHTYMHNHAYTHVCAHICIHSYTHACMHTYAFTLIHTCTHPHTCTHYISTYAHTHIHICMHSHASTQRLVSLLHCRDCCEGVPVVSSRSVRLLWLSSSVDMLASRVTWDVCSVSHSHHVPGSERAGSEGKAVLTQKESKNNDVEVLFYLIGKSFVSVSNCKRGISCCSYHPQAHSFIRFQVAGWGSRGAESTQGYSFREKHMSGLLYFLRFRSLPHNTFLV